MNQTFQRTAKFIMANFYEMDLMNGIVILVKKDEIYNILKTMLATDYWLFSSSSTRLLRLSLIKGQSSSPCHDFSLLFQSSRPEVFCGKCVLRNFVKFTGKHLC